VHRPSAAPGPRDQEPERGGGGRTRVRFPPSPLVRRGRQSGTCLHDSIICGWIVCDKRGAACREFRRTPPIELQASRRSTQRVRPTRLSC
jgi:hypothetical protein